MSKELFGTFSAEIPDKPESAIISSVEGSEKLRKQIQDMAAIDFLEELLRSRAKAEKTFSELLSRGEVIKSGAIAGRRVEYTGRIDPDSKRLQGYVTDTTERDKLKRGFVYLCGVLARASHANDETTGQHIERVSIEAGKLAELLGLSSEFVYEVSLFAPLHDVGKIGYDRSLLNKEGRLTEEEFELIKEHPIIGAEILGNAQELRMARNIALYHHEKWNGDGYPSGLSGEKIPLEARIVAIVDVYDALVSKRSYKGGFSYTRTLGILRHDNGAFDPDILSVFMGNYLEFKKIHSELKH